MIDCPVETSLESLVLDCISGDSLLCRVVSPSRRERRSVHWMDVLMAEAFDVDKRRMDRKVFLGDSDAN